MTVRQVLWLSVSLALFAAASAAMRGSAQTLDEAESCKAALDAPIAAPDLTPERPEGYVECIQADELYAELIDFSTRWVACFDAADAACLAELYDEDALLAPDGTDSLHGAARIARHYGDRFGEYGDGDSARIALLYDSVDAAGDRPVVVQRWRMALSGPGRSEKSSGRTLLILKRGEDGAFRIWREFGNDAPDTAPESWPEGLY